jgi:putative salt-induced outer membrane protein
MHKTVALVAALSLAPVSVAAQAAPPPPRVGIVVDLGYVSSSGNTDVSTFSLGEKLTWRAGSRVVVTQFVRSVYGETGDSVSANSLNVGAAAEAPVVGRFGAKIGAAFERNRFAGIARRTEESVGLIAKFNTDRDNLCLEAGAVWTQQRGVDDSTDDFVSLRGAVCYKRVLRGAAYFQQNVEALPNLETSDDWRVNSESALVAPLSARVGLKLSYVIRYDNLPEPTFEKSDRILTAGVQITR